MGTIYVGIDLGGTNIKGGCFDEDMNLLSKDSVPTNAKKGPFAVCDKMAELCELLVKKSDRSFDELAAVGFGTPGPSNLTDGVIIKAPNLPKFVNVPMRQMLSEKLGKSCVMENDANAAAWGEFVLGAAKDVNDMIFFTLGTGIGGGVVCNGELVHGFGDVGAELGHVIIYPDGDRQCGCGQKGCVEAYASASSTAARAKEAVASGTESTLKAVLDKKGDITCKEVFEHAAKGDSLATEIVEGTAKALGILCVNMFHVTGPKRIVFAGGMIAAGDQLLSRIQHYFKEYNWDIGADITICFATLGEDAGIIGTAALARKAYS